MSDTDWATADLIDAHPGTLGAVLLPLRNYGGVRKFAGEIATVRVFQDYRPVLAALEAPGRGRILIVDAGGSPDRAVLGERLLNTAARHGWSGVVVNGAVRDTGITRDVPIGLRALGTVPQRGESGAPASTGEPVTFGGVTFQPGEWLWADDDGIVVGPRPGSAHLTR